MKVTPRTVVGFLVGINGFLALATVAVIAANGASNPGVSTYEHQSAAAGGSAPEPLRNGSFEGLDLDGDGRITLAEAAGHNDVVLRFNRADRNRDGKLTKAEFERLAKLPEPKAASAKGKPFRRSDATAAAGG